MPVFIQKCLDVIIKNYWTPLFQYVKLNPDLIKTVPGFLIDPEKIIIYIGKTHLGLEYIGPTNISKLPKGKKKLAVHIINFTDSTKNYLEQIIGFRYNLTDIDNSFLLPDCCDDLILPTDLGAKKLVELKWNFFAQNMTCILTSGNLKLRENEFYRWINSYFFDADENGLKTRNIKWIDFIPLKYYNEKDIFEDIGINMGNYNIVQSINDAQYVFPIPMDFKYEKLQQINRFIELIANKNLIEPRITKFLTNKENEFIIKMAFCATKIYAQKECEWQSDKKVNIIPDFFVEKPNGYSDIVEFKLPELERKAIIGYKNRETFSSVIQSYISQTRVYKEYFNDPNNRRWVENKFNIKINNPKRYLVIGRRFDFDGDTWREIIADYNDFEIITYDDLIDGVTAQFYK